mmetsp:Transcript_132679/g.330966  ORF Transcript_132679/g.330966 Transcript_132679/m.330966 type:complete len:200 (+) Transcript_132679:456-1055(+)
MPNGYWSTSYRRLTQATSVPCASSGVCTSSRGNGRRRLVVIGGCCWPSLATQSGRGNWSIAWREPQVLRLQCLPKQTRLSGVVVSKATEATAEAAVASEVPAAVPPMAVVARAIVVGTTLALHQRATHLRLEGGGELAVLAAAAKDEVIGVALHMEAVARKTFTAVLVLCRRPPQGSARLPGSRRQVGQRQLWPRIEAS